jgi:hypothetical protein
MAIHFLILQTAENIDMLDNIKYVNEMALMTRRCESNLTLYWFGESAWMQPTFAAT